MTLRATALNWRMCRHCPARPKATAHSIGQVIPVTTRSSAINLEKGMLWRVSHAGVATFNILYLHTVLRTTVGMTYLPQQKPSSYIITPADSKSDWIGNTALYANSLRSVDLAIRLTDKKALLRIIMVRDDRREDWWQTPKR
jgi:hypothetical protein